MELATSVFVPLAVSLGGALLGAPLVESLRNRHQRREMRANNRKDKILEWDRLISQIENQHPGWLFFRETSEYLSFKKYLRKRVITSIDALIPADRWPDPITDEEFLQHKRAYDSAVLMLKEEVARLEKKWWLM